MDSRWIEKNGYLGAKLNSGIRRNINTFTVQKEIQIIDWILWLRACHSIRGQLIIRLRNWSIKHQSSKSF